MHEKLGLELSARVVGYEFDALSKRYLKVTIGAVQPKYGETQKKYADQQKAETTTALERAIAGATNLITGNSGGYIVFRPAEKPQEILVMDEPEMAKAKKVWRWNLAGLGYSSTGVNGPFALAMTMDGAIVADFITAGILNGALIKAGSISAGAISQEYKGEVADAITGAENRVTQAFQAADGQLSSTISQNYLTKTGAASAYATQSALTQTADSITAEVTRAKTAETSLSSSISQNAQNITLKVSKGDVSSQISAESGAISLSSNRISISSTYFSLTNAGRLTCTGATVGGTLETSGGYGYVTLSNGRVIGGYNSSEAGYISFNHTYNSSPAPRIAGTNGIVLATPYLAVSSYAPIGTSATAYQGQSASQSFVTRIEDNGNGTITWYTRTITFTKGLMTTAF